MVRCKLNSGNPGRVKGGNLLIKRGIRAPPFGHQLFQWGTPQILDSIIIIKGLRLQTPKLSVRSRSLPTIDITSGRQKNCSIGSRRLSTTYVCAWGILRGESACGGPLTCTAGSTWPASGYLICYLTICLPQPLGW